MIRVNENCKNLLGGVFLMPKPVIFNLFQELWVFIDYIRGSRMGYGKTNQAENLSLGDCV